MKYLLRIIIYQIVISILIYSLMDFTPQLQQMPLMLVYLLLFFMLLSLNSAFLSLHRHKLFAIAFGSFAIVYIMFQKKMFSKANTLIISKLLFYPTFPITVMMRLGNYWNVVDKTVILGCVRELGSCVCICLVCYV